MNKNLSSSIETLFKQVSTFLKTEGTSENKRELKKKFNSLLTKDIDKTISLAQDYREKNHFNEGIEILKERIVFLKKIRDVSIRKKLQQKLEDHLDALYSDQIDAKCEEARKLKEQSKFDKAVQLLSGSLGIPKKMYNSKKQARIRKKINNKIRETKIAKIRRTILELGTKFPRLQIVEIAEECNEDEELIEATVDEMIASGDIYAKYFTSSRAVAFDQQANIDEIDNLMDAYKNWELTDEGKKD